MRTYQVDLYDAKGDRLCSLPYFAMRGSDVASFGRNMRDMTSGAVAFRYEEV